MRPSVVRLGSFYLLFYTSIAAFTPFINLYLQARGLTGEQIGIVLAILPAVGMLAQPMWGMLADRTGQERSIVSLCITVPPLVLLLFHHATTMALSVLMIGLFALFQPAVLPIVDSMTIMHRGVSNYGKVRLFGSIGYALTTTIAGWLYRGDGILHLPFVCLAASGLAICMWWTYPIAKSTLQAKAIGLRREGAMQLLSNTRFCVLLGITFLVAVSMAINNSFFSLYYHDLGHPMRDLGLIYGAGSICELPFMFVVGRLMARFGEVPVYLCGAAVFAGRWIVLGFHPSTLVLLFLQMLHGISFSFTYAAGIAIAARASGESTRATAQSLYSSVNTGLAVIVGSLTGGIIYSSFGPADVYKFAAMFAVLGIVLMSVKALHDKHQGT